MARIISRGMRGVKGIAEVVWTIAGLGVVVFVLVLRSQKSFRLKYLEIRGLLRTKKNLGDHK